MSITWVRVPQFTGTVACGIYLWHLLVASTDGIYLDA